MTDGDDDMATRGLVLAASIKPLLSGKGREVQGAALADLVSTWLAGHNPSARFELFETWLRAVRNLVPVQEREMFKTRERPEGWE